ncbi:hypothetical protein [Actinophytocola xanthii]|uniref:Uncharacterized protein n=1 Tax=Actinophytocola xanthii TaxID=1912961 RepID=A0A1Q8CKQ2_9PSEU|nr:hypothetical protein [Actinophytocola xanthii]OLF14933.1 hypothetical protein BU204_24670 [Actinophytocola xanthii]
MLDGIASAGAKALGGARFSLVNFLPAALVAAFVIFLFASGVYTDAAPRPGEAISVFRNAGFAVLAVFGVFVLAILLRPFQAALVHLLEGYWVAWPTRLLAGAATERHRRILHTATVIRGAELRAEDPPDTSLRAAAAHRRAEREIRVINDRAVGRVERYPASVFPDREDFGPDEYDNRLMPTLLGNILRDGEDRAGGRYGLDFTAIAPRLYAALSPKFDAVIRQSLDLLDVMAAMCVSFAVGAAISLPLVGRWDVWSLVPLVLALLSVFAYRGAIRVATSHGRYLAAAVDLHRFDMIAALHYELPADPERERSFNVRLSEFLNGRNTASRMMRGDPYVHPTDVEPRAEDGAADEQASSAPS